MSEPFLFRGIKIVAVPQIYDGNFACNSCVGTTLDFCHALPECSKVVFIRAEEEEAWARRAVLFKLTGSTE